MTRVDIEMAPSMLMNKEIELANTCYGAARCIDQYATLVLKAQDTIKQREEQINEDTRQVCNLVCTQCSVFL